MYAPNSHTCSVIPLWRVNNSVLFLYPWKERKKKKEKFRIHVEKSDMAGFKIIFFRFDKIIFILNKIVGAFWYIKKNVLTCIR
jgi:hypothetical protein